MNLEGIDLVENAEPPPKSKRKWSDEENIVFIEVLKKHPCLWRSPKTLPRDIALLAMCNELKERLDIPELTTDITFYKVRYMKERFAVEWKRVQKRYKEDGVYKSRFVWFELAESFLGPLYEPDAATENARKSEAGESSKNLAINSTSDKPTSNEKYFDVEIEDQFGEFGSYVAQNLRKMALPKAYALYEEMQNIINERRISLMNKEQNITVTRNKETLPYITSLKSMNSDLEDGLASNVVKKEFVPESELLDLYPAPSISISNQRTYSRKKKKY